MELIEIEAFVCIVETGSFTRAAERLSLSQPAISRRIEVLEAELEVALFDRLPAGSRLTDAGAAFLPFAERILADCRDAAAAVRELRDGASGEISLAIVGTLASTTLFARMASFRSAFPGIRLRLQTANSATVSRLVASGEARIGLRYFDDPAPALLCRTIATERMVVACAGDASLAGSVEDTGTLAGQPWVCFPTGTGSSGEPFARLLDRTLLALGLDDAERIPIDSLTAQKRMIEAGFGIGLVPASAIAEEVRLGSIRTTYVAGVNVVAPITLVQRRGGYESAAMRQLVAHLTTSA